MLCIYRMALSMRDYILDTDIHSCWAIPAMKISALVYHRLYELSALIGHSKQHKFLN